MVEKMFVHYSGSKAAFIAAGLETKYTNSIVFIGNGECVYTHGKYYGNIDEALTALKYFSKISDGTNTYEAAAPNGELKFTSDAPQVVTVSADAQGIHFGLAKEFTDGIADVAGRVKAIEDAPYATTQNVADAKAEVIGDAANDTKDSKTIEGVIKLIDDKTSGIASEGVVNDLSNRVKAIEDAPYATEGFVADEIGKLGHVQTNEGDYVSAIKQTNGIVTVTMGTFNFDEAGAAQAVKEELLGAVADADAKTIAALNDKIESVEGAAKSYSIEKIETGLATNVKEAYKLVDEDGAQAGATINIYKDSALIKVKLSTVDATWDAGSKDIINGTGNEALAYAYEDVNGEVQVVAIDVADFLRESEFSNGLEVNNGVVTVKVDAASEEYLTVSSDGVKVSGINDKLAEKVDASKFAELIGIETDEDVNNLAWYPAAYISSGDTVFSALNKLDKAISDVDAAGVTAEEFEASVGVAAGSKIKTSNEYHVKGEQTVSAAVDTLDVELKDVEDRIDALDLAEVSGYITKVSQVDGQVAAEAVASIPAADVTVADAESKLEATTVEAALTELAKMWEWEEL